MRNPLFERIMQSDLLYSRIYLKDRNFYWVNGDIMRNRGSCWEVSVCRIQNLSCNKCSNVENYFFVLSEIYLKGSKSMKKKINEKFMKNYKCRNIVCYLK